MKNPFLTGKKIYLSPLTVDDITDEYVSWLNNAETCEGNSHAVFPNNFPKTKAYVESVQNSKTDIVFAIRLVKDDEQIGNASLQNVNWVNRSGEIAMIIGNKDYRGKGIGADVMDMLIGYGFNTLNLNRISSATPVTNEGGISICKKNNMQKEGLLREVMFKDGKYLDVGVYSILKKDYKKKTEKDVI